VRAVALAVKEKFRDTRLAALLYLKSIESGLAKGYKTVEASWIHEDNTSMNKALERMGFEKRKIFRIYDYPLA
jgi:RimJ/RimL family protein N-acetyltransferase